MALEKLMYSLPESAAILGDLSINVLKRDIKRGKIQARKYGRRVLIPREELIRIAKEGMESARATA